LYEWSLTHAKNDRFAADGSVCSLAEIEPGRAGGVRQDTIYCVIGTGMAD